LAAGATGRDGETLSLFLRLKDPSHSDGADMAGNPSRVVPTAG